MKIVLDTDTIKNKGADTDTVLYLLSLLLGYPITKDTFEKVRQNRLIDFSQLYNPMEPFPTHVSINNTGKFFIESMMANSNSTNDSNRRCEELAKKLRELFPAGKKPGYAYTWRDSESCIKDRLLKFFLKYDSEYNKYTDEQIINATKKYVASFNGNYQYMQLLKYFIWKNKVTGEQMVGGRIIGEVEKLSQLAAYLEDTEEKNVSEDWGVTLS